MGSLSRPDRNFVEFSFGQPLGPGTVVWAVCRLIQTSDGACMLFKLIQPAAVLPPPAWPGSVFEASVIKMPDGQDYRRDCGYSMSFRFFAFRSGPFQLEE